jgi:plasmid maintenance system antidote protein VapI
MEAFLKAIDDLDAALDETEEMIAAMRRRSESIRQAHRRGTRLREIVPREETPLLVQLLTRTTELLQSYGNRVRRTEARTLHGEGLTMDEIAVLFGVSRQRVSALLRDRAEPEPDG